MNRTSLIRNRPLRRLARTLVGRERIGDSDGGGGGGDIDNAVLDSADNTTMPDSADPNVIITDEEA
jgi:hypothetical protein